MTPEEVIKYIEQMSVMELAKLVKELEAKFEIKAAPMVASVAAGAPAAAAAPGEAPEEKDSFDVVLAIVGDKKIKVIKVVREVTNLGLKEAKDLVDNAPKPVKEGIPKKEAEEIKAKFQEVGAQVELK
ncbi:MAG: 50S ribosomal protein L7/L12 [Candidatus Aminicenantes bacterium]|nr:50S ribosomal protein L7/L12 [Candidatus Aminicenantes bacterium]MDH5714201.1 50S ribosomal protein L7/L12 [Candidatus Aminicenantes bacterium]